MPLKQELKKGENGWALNVYGRLLLDGVEWETSAWLHWHPEVNAWCVGLPTDSRQYAIDHCLSASRVVWTTKQWKSTPAIRRKLALAIEFEVNGRM
jgi:hypothetical protein